MTLQSIHRQNGYGAHKRQEHCEMCYAQRHKVGIWRVEYDDGSKRFFCDDHVSVAFGDRMKIR